MPGLTQAEYEAQLVVYNNALAAVGAGQNYSIGDRSMTRASLPEIRKTIDWLEDKIERLETSNGKRRIRGGTPVD